MFKLNSNDNPPRWVFYWRKELKSKLITVAIAVLIAVVFYILMLLVDDQHQVTVATSFVFGLSFSLLMRRSFKRQLRNSITAKQEHSCAYLIMHQVEGIHKAKAIVRKIPEHILGTTLVRMTHYDPIFCKYWYAEYCKRTNQEKFYCEHLSILQAFANPNPPRLIPLESIENAIKEITEGDDWQGGQLRYK